MKVGDDAEEREEVVVVEVEVEVVEMAAAKEADEGEEKMGLKWSVLEWIGPCMCGTGHRRRAV